MLPSPWEPCPWPRASLRNGPWLRETIAERLAAGVVAMRMARKRARKTSSALQENSKMIPEIFAANYGNPLLLTMDSMVGKGAPNKRADVMLVQSLLVASSSARGIVSTRPIDVDGIVGPQTTQAITT